MEKSKLYYLNKTNILRWSLVQIVNAIFYLITIARSRFQLFCYIFYAHPCDNIFAVSSFEVHDSVPSIASLCKSYER
jgi:hypothetical protein